MKKVLIISYFFPPCTLTAAQRPFFWARYLKDYGYYPIIVTRKWDSPIKQPADVLKSTSSGISHEKKNGYEVYSLPYRASLRDQVFVKFTGTPLSILSKFLTLIYLIFQNISLRFIPHRNIYTLAKKLIKEDPTINKVVISANPFEQFFFGYLLQKREGIKWIADYRDDWTTSELKLSKNIAQKFISKLERKSEKKWVSTANKITSVSSHYVKKISTLTKRPGEVLLNGFQVSEEKKIKEDPYSIFSIVYNGTLYSTQPVELFLDTVKQVADKWGKDKIHIYFPGLAFDKNQAKRVGGYISGYESCFTIMPRISKAEVIKMQNKAQLMLMIPHKGLIGIPSSKLFEYLGLKKSILLLPSDGDIIEEILLDSNLGKICTNISEAVEIINQLMHLFYNGEYLDVEPSPNWINYSRYNQTKILAETLDSL